MPRGRSIGRMYGKYVAFCQTTFCWREAQVRKNLPPSLRYSSIFLDRFDPALHKKYLPDSIDMKQLNKSTGNKGEKAAAEMLEQKGYEILARNYRSKWGEVDIVARLVGREEYRVFVEVKTKTGEEYGEPWEMIDHHKLQKVENMGHLWCEEYGWSGLCRVDVVGVWLDEAGEVARIEHWENVQL